MTYAKRNPLLLEESLTFDSTSYEEIKCISVNFGASCTVLLNLVNCGRFLALGTLSPDCLLRQKHWNCFWDKGFSKGPAFFCWELRFLDLWKSGPLISQSDTQNEGKKGLDTLEKLSQLEHHKTTSDSYKNINRLEMYITCLWYFCPAIWGKNNKQIARWHASI